MLRQYIELGNSGWHVYVYYGMSSIDAGELTFRLRELNCPEEYIKKALRIMTTGLNTGMTFSNSAYKTSLVCIGRTSSKEQFVNTVVHEAKHVQSHICQYYNIKEDGETAAYLIGHIVQKMYRNLMKVEYRYYD